MRWWQRVGAWDDEHRFGVDAVATALTALVAVPTSVALGTGAAAPLLSLAMVVPLAWRRTRPAPSAATVFGIALLHLLAGEYLVLPADLAVLLALYSVTVHGPVWAYRTAILGSLVGSVLLGAAMLVQGGAPDAPSAAASAFGVALVALSTFAFALVRRSRRETIDALVDRARRLEIERDQQAQIATAAERTRIAREMHDIVAHSLSVIIAQADGGRYAAQADPDAAARSLTTIGETGRAALADMRRLLGVLRTGPGTADPSSGTALATGRPASGPAAGPPPPPGLPPGPPRPGLPPGPPPPPPTVELAPQPAVEDIAGLVDHVRDAGVEVSLVRMGTPRALPPGTGLTVFRICQESLTNVLKHAGPKARATVLLQWAPTSLVLEVADDGRGAAAGSDGAGQGVLGMRERAAMLGGTLAVGPRAGGGFRVRAEIPLPPAPQERP